MHSPIFFTVVLLLVLHTPTPTALLFPKRTIILLAGQSNMVGKGGINFTGAWDGIVPSESEPNPKILRLNNELEWEVAREPLHSGISAGPFGVGPGLPFANSILQPLETIILVPCAQEQTSITEWQRGTMLYNRTLTRAHAAIMGGGGEIRGMLWYQGEADSNDKAAADAYKGRLVQFFNDLRTDLSSPFLPIIQVALAKENTELRKVVREAQLQTGLPYVFCVDAYKLNVTLQKDGLNIHLDTPSQVKLGKALASVFLSIS